jgi:hypothetical protein
MPNTPALRAAYLDLHLAREGSEEDKKRVGDVALLPRPWDPSTCTRKALRTEVWAWLDQFVIWFNHEYTWDYHAGMIPACWTQHPHLIREIAVLADQRRRAALDTTSSSMEEWHRYCIPAFYDRFKTRTKVCEEGHKPWPAKARQDGFTAAAAVEERRTAFNGDVASLGSDSTPEREASADQPPTRPTLHIIGTDGERIDPATGEVLT